MTVIGWTDAYGSGYSAATFTTERKKALIERIRKRKYNFNHADHQFLPYAAPFYDDNVVCVLTKPQWDSVMSEAYDDMSRGARLMPMDIIDRQPIKSVLYEKEKFEPKGDVDNG